MTAANTELERLRQALAASGDLAYEWDLAGDRITWFHDAAARHDHAFITDAATGEDFNALVYPEDQPYRLEAISSLQPGAIEYESEFRLRHDGNKPRWFHDRGVAELSPEGEAVRLRGVLRPMGARKGRDARVDNHVNYDTLTGHYNRTRLREALDYALYYSQRYRVEGAYLVIASTR